MSPFYSGINDVQAPDSTHMVR